MEDFMKKTFNVEKAFDNLALDSTDQKISGKANVSKLYAIRDRVAGLYGEPWVSPRDELAVRRFDYIMSNAPMVADDCELYKVGFYDNTSGKIFPIEPDFVIKYDKKRGEKYE